MATANNEKILTRFLYTIFKIIAATIEITDSIKYKKSRRNLGVTNRQPNRHHTLYHN